MKNLARPVVAALMISLGLLAWAPSAQAASRGDYFVVDTQFWSAPSPIIEAGGAFATCTSVTDLSNLGEQISPNRVIFIGDKQVNCADGSVVIHYNATLNFSSGKKTYGHWFVVESSLPGVEDGFGTVRGDSSRCEILSGSLGCIRDVFAGETG